MERCSKVHVQEWIAVWRKVEPLVLAEVKREVERSKKRLEELRVSL
jgi:hypothetical protein